jgi:RecB family exonuclease
MEWGMRRTEKRVDYALKFLKQLEEDPMFEYRNRAAESPIYRLLEAFMDYNDGIVHSEANDSTSSSFAELRWLENSILQPSAESED